jgi:hypothetical protein
MRFVKIFRSLLLITQQVTSVLMLPSRPIAQYSEEVLGLKKFVLESRSGCED